MALIYTNKKKHITLVLNIYPTSLMPHLNVYFSILSLWFISTYNLWILPDISFHNSGVNLSWHLVIKMQAQEFSFYTWIWFNASTKFLLFNFVYSISKFFFIGVLTYSLKLKRKNQLHYWIFRKATGIKNQNWNEW